ncbi:MAG TPA: methionine synthase, partial [Nitrospirota bacterium]|nr:methionine synthase [Nitrospirota bacterium]
LSGRATKKGIKAMTHSFNCIATGIGSLPITDADKAAILSLTYLPEAPIWPQLPQKDFREHMDSQYSESLPGLRLDEAKERFFFDTSKDLTPELEKFFERYIEKDYGFFKISEEYAAGFYAFLRALKKGLPAGARFIKGHITGPLTAGISFKDESGKDIIHNEMLFDAVVKGLAMKAAWQIQDLNRFGKPVIIFIDEPAMESLGSAFSAVSSDVVTEKLNEIIAVIHELGGIAGIHCCGNADWPMLFNTDVDIINFDAFGYMERVLLYPDEIKTFYGRGGALAWGIVPTGAFTGKETPEMLIAKLDAGMKRLELHGIKREVVLRQCIITPSCGMGSLTPDKAEAILRLLREVSDRMQKAI